MSTALSSPDQARAALETAAAKLARSPEGQEAARLMHRFLRGAGGSLDASNQAAIMVLLAAAFGPLTAAVLDLLTVAATGTRIVIEGRDADL